MRNRLLPCIMNAIVILAIDVVSRTAPVHLVVLHANLITYYLCCHLRSSARYCLPPKHIKVKNRQWILIPIKILFYIHDITIYALLFYVYVRLSDNLLLEDNLCSARVYVVHFLLAEWRCLKPFREFLYGVENSPRAGCSLQERGRQLWDC